MRSDVGAIAITAMAVLGGCADEVDDLDRELLLELARTPGTATGSGYSGTWSVMVTLDRCTCPAILGAPVVCIPDQPPYYGVISVIEDGGMISLVSGLQGGNTPALSYVGGVDDDGSFSLAAVRHESTVGLTSNALSRLDGSFDHGDDDTAFARSFDATLAVRIVSSLAVEIAGYPDRIDCRGDYTLLGSR